MDGQLCAIHIILRYKPISSSFQSPKYIIKVKDPQLKQINVAVPRFLASPPPEAPKVARPADASVTKATSEPTQVPSKESEVAKEKEASREKEAAKDKTTKHPKPPLTAKVNSPPPTSN
nr:hypothetical protein CFP56_33391 [Quercus suber]